MTILLLLLFVCVGFVGGGRQSLVGLTVKPIWTSSTCVCVYIYIYICLGVSGSVYYLGWAGSGSFVRQQS